MRKLILLFGICLVAFTCGKDSDEPEPNINTAQKFDLAILEVVKILEAPVLKITTLYNEDFTEIEPLHQNLLIVANQKTLTAPMISTTPLPNT